MNFLMKIAIVLSIYFSIGDVFCMNQQDEKGDFNQCIKIYKKLLVDNKIEEKKFKPTNEIMQSLEKVNVKKTKYIAEGEYFIYQNNEYSILYTVNLIDCIGINIWHKDKGIGLCHLLRVSQKTLKGFFEEISKKVQNDFSDVKVDIVATMYSDNITFAINGGTCYYNDHSGKYPSCVSLKVPGLLELGVKPENIKIEVENINHSPRRCEKELEEKIDKWKVNKHAVFVTEDCGAPEIRRGVYTGFGPLSLFF